jgi:hypothetical protein
MKQCEGLEGGALDKCKRRNDVILENALDECTPKTPCEERAEEAYAVKMEECLANGGSQENCEAEAQEYKKKVQEECECNEKARAEYEAHEQKCEGLDAAE